MELITKREAAKLAGVSPDTIRRWQANGELHAYARRQPSGQVADMVDKDELLSHQGLVERAPTGPFEERAIVFCLEHAGAHYELDTCVDLHDVGPEVRAEFEAEEHAEWIANQA